MPDFLSQFLLKKIEKKYDIDLSVRDRNHEILPELFYKVSETIYYYFQKYTGEKLTNLTLTEYGTLKNYITKNQFYIDKEPREKAREIENNILEYIILRSDLYRSHPDDRLEEKNRDLEIKKEIIIKLQKELEEVIYKILKD